MPEKPKQGGDLRRDDGVELETQLVLRIPEEPAKALREAIQTGATNLKDRFNIRLENDIRYGEVRFDHWLMHAKVVDLPTIIESLKTIDNKSFYKTADICQMMICKFEPDLPTIEEESPNKNKKKDPNKVDKKFLWPHGITPPCKNVRKRRFRKTLKKKYVEAPEIEKEVKRLLRVDNEAVNVKWEIINEEEDQKLPHGTGKSGSSRESKASKASQKAAMREQPSDSLASSRNTSRDVGEHDIFGGEVSSSDDDDNNEINVMELDDNSRMSADDSRLSDSNSMQNMSDKMATEFNRNMFSSPKSRKSSSGLNIDRPNTPGHSNRDYYGDDRHDSDNEGDYNISRESVTARIAELRRQLSDLRSQRIQKEQEISSIENQTLRQRLQDTLENLLSQILDKEMELQELQSL